MSFESGGEQRNSALDKLKQRAPSLTDQHPNVLYTMPMQTVEQLESVLRSTLALQENIRSSMSELATKESLQPLATAEELLNWVNKVQELNQEMHQSMRQVLAEMQEENRQAGKKRDEFLRTLSDMEQRFRRDGEDMQSQIQIHTLSGRQRGRTVPPLDAYDVHRRGGGVHGVQHSDADLAEITEKIVRLLSRLEGSASDEVVDCTTRVYHGDRKALTKEREQKIAMGHKADDHEEQQMM